MGSKIWRLDIFLDFPTSTPTLGSNPPPPPLPPPDRNAFFKGDKAMNKATLLSFFV